MALVAACWLSAGSTPFVDAVDGRLSGRLGARLRDGARPPRGRTGATPPRPRRQTNGRVRYGAPRVVLLAAPYYIHPPPASLAVLPFAWLPWRTAALAWAAGSLVALVWLAFSLLRIWTPGEAPPASRVTLLTLVLAVWPPTLYCLEKGQWSIWLAALLAAGWTSLEERRAGRAGGLLGVAAALKITPIVVVGHLLSRGPPRGGRTLATTGRRRAGFARRDRPDGLVPVRDEASRNEVAWAPWLANSASLERDLRPPLDQQSLLAADRRGASGLLAARSPSPRCSSWQSPSERPIGGETNHPESQARVLAAG